MGTRNLTCVVLNGEYKVAQYGQWDGYPSGQGLTALRFLRDMDRDSFVAKVAAARWITQEELTAIGASWEETHGHLSRDHGAEILGLVAAADDGIALIKKLDFAADSLFCEWAYVIDLDKNTFEVFEGFNEQALAEGERFAFLNDKAEREYKPIRHLHTFSLDSLPSEEEFVAILEPAEET